VGVRHLFAVSFIIEVIRLRERWMMVVGVGDVVNWAVFEYDRWRFVLAASEDGLCYVGSPGQHFDVTEHLLRRRFTSAAFVENERALMPFIEEMRAYFAGEAKGFSLPVDVKGTPFQEEVWRALQEIPYGETSSYSEIANRIQRPAAVRAVGTAIGANPVLISVPCHRVIGKSGAITGYRGGIDMKQYLLELEKVGNHNKIIF
jgi:methylated-DNA-[protein]-cysteine S-methyltransferase